VSEFLAQGNYVLTKWRYWDSNLGLPNHESSAIPTRPPYVMIFIAFNVAVGPSYPYDQSEASAGKNEGD
jgi:hypothetical protein